MRFYAKMFFWCMLNIHFILQMLQTNKSKRVARVQHKQTLTFHIDIVFLLPSRFKMKGKERERAIYFFMHSFEFFCHLKLK